MPQIYTCIPLIHNMYTDVTLKGFLQHTLIAVIIEFIACVTCVWSFRSVFFGPLKCQMRIDKHAVNQQTEIISYQLGVDVAVFPLCKSFVNTELQCTWHKRK